MAERRPPRGGVCVGGQDEALHVQYLQQQEEPRGGGARARAPAAGHGTNQHNGPKRRDCVANNSAAPEKNWLFSSTRKTRLLLNR